jgi:hypothetical protein
MITYDAGCTATALIEDCVFENWDYALYAYDGTDDNSGIIDMTAHGIDFSTNTTGFGSNEISLQHAENNYWGDASGPHNTNLNPNGLGVEVMDNITFFPYYTDAAMTTLCDMPPVYNSTQETYAATIQGAINAANDYDVIMVAPGTYYESIEITKPLSLYGATYSTAKDDYTIPANDIFDETVESIIIDPNPTVDHNATVLIQNTDDVNFKGFVIQQFDANNREIDALIYVYALDNSINNIDVSNNVVGPFTNTTAQDGSEGGFGIVLSGKNSGGNDMTNIDIHHNLIYKTEGNGSCIMAIGGYHYNETITPSNMTGSTIRNNTVFGSHRCGIEIVSGLENLIVEGNEIYNNSGYTGDDPDKLKYGSGILVIRGSADKLLNAELAHAPENIIIRNNEIYNNEKNGIYWGPKNYNNLIEGNNIHNNGWDGIMIDLFGQYWNPTFEPEPTALQHAISDGSMNVVAKLNVIEGNGVYGARVAGTPTNGFQLQAQLNYWGDATGPKHIDTNPDALGDEVSDYVVFEPFYDNPNMTGSLLLSTVSVPTDAYPNLNAALNAVADEGTIQITGDFDQPAVTIDKSVTITAVAGVDPVITPLCSTTGALITVDYNTEVEITDLTFDFSGTNANGAVIAMQGTEATISGCTFTGHATTGSGERALVITNGAEVAVQACTFTGFGSGTETGTEETEAAIHIHNGGGNAPEVEITPDNYFDNNYIGIHVGIDEGTEDNSEVLINGNVFGETTCNAYAVKIENHNSEVTAHENIFHCHTIYMVSAPTGSAPFDFSYNYWEDGCPAKGGTYEGDINDVPQYTDENLNNLDVSVFVNPANSLTTGLANGLTYNVNISNVTCMGGFDVTLTIADADFSNITFAEGTFLSSQGTTTWQPSNSGESYTLSCSLDGTVNNATGAGTLFSITLDTKDVENLTGALIDITAVTLRGPNNEPIACSGFADGIVVIDNTAPAMTALVEAENAYYNTIPTFATFEFTDNHGLNVIEFNHDGTVWHEVANDIAGTTWDGTEGNTPAVYTLPVFSALSEGVHTIYWRVTDDAGNTDTFEWTFYKDTQIPAGNLAMAISGVTTTGMTITGAAVADAVEGHEYYIFDCLTDNVYDKLRAEDINQYDLTGMGTNTLYQFKYKVTDGVTNNHAATAWEDDANISDWSYTYSRHTLSVPPTIATVTCDKTPETWYNDATFTFTSVDGFGEGTNVEYYRYVWDRHATHSWNGMEAIWDANDLALTATDGDDWYLHVKGYNGDNIANGTLDLGPFYFDGTAPYAVAALNGHITENANESVSLSWLDDSQEANFEHYEIFAATFGNYPTYTGGSEKTAPADRAAAYASSDWTSIGTTTDLTYTHNTPATRDYYYYVVFAKDLAGNYSPVSGMTECLSYWLGDVAEANGIVNGDDISLLAAAWGGDVASYPDRNVGPTVDGARDSRPDPDDAIDFEDLMIFSMNYNNTNYSTKVSVPQKGEIYVSMHREVVDGKLVAKLYLTGNENNIHGLNIKLAMGDDLTPENIRKGDIWSDMDFFMYTNEEGILEITGATLGNGTTIAGDGQIAEIEFTMSGENTMTDFAEVIARDVTNQDIDIILNPITGISGSYSTESNLSTYPNPFRSTTTITYTVEEPGMVRLMVYNHNGQVVRTLSEEMQSAGEHTIRWDGCDEKGTALPTGIYFLHIHNGNNTGCLKTILTR